MGDIDTLAPQKQWFQGKVSEVNAAGDDGAKRAKIEEIKNQITTALNTATSEQSKYYRNALACLNGVIEGRGTNINQCPAMAEKGEGVAVEGELDPILSNTVGYSLNPDGAGGKADSIFWQPGFYSAEAGKRVKVAFNASAIISGNRTGESISPSDSEGGTLTVAGAVEGRLQFHIIKPIYLLVSATGAAGVGWNDDGKPGVVVSAAYLMGVGVKPGDTVAFEAGSYGGPAVAKFIGTPETYGITGLGVAAQLSF